MSGKNQLKGVYSAMLTPLHKDGRINYEETARLAKFLVNNGVAGLFAVSSIGEGIHFSVEECLAYYQTVCKEVGDAVEVIPGATTSCTYNTIALVKAYQQVGCNTVVIAPPYFYSTSDHDLIQYYRDIIAQTGCDIIIYNIPLFSTPVSDYVIEQLVQVPNIVGIKDSSGDGIKMMQIIKHIENHKSTTHVLTGREELFVSSMLNGADGCMVGTASIIPEVIVAIKDAYEAGDLPHAQRYQFTLVDATKAMFDLPFPMGFKIALEQRGFSMGGMRKSVDISRIHNFEQKCEMIRRCVNVALNEIQNGNKIQ
ncbi:MAG: dihydrodipicolinate synthase family protein [Candidatus Fimivivens sp.]